MTAHLLFTVHLCLATCTTCEQPPNHYTIRCRGPNIPKESAVPFCSDDVNDPRPFCNDPYTGMPRFNLDL